MLLLYYYQMIIFIYRNISLVLVKLSVGMDWFVGLINVLLRMFVLPIRSVTKVDVLIIIVLVIKLLININKSYLNSIDSLDSLDSLDSFDSLDSLDSFDSLDSLDSINALDSLDSINALDSID